jgi:ribosomal protein S18 acetylase RimI-like enzyme
MITIIPFKTSNKELIKEFYSQNQDFHVSIDPFNLRKNSKEYVEQEMNELEEKIKENHAFVIIAKDNKTSIGFGVCYIQKQKKEDLFKMKNVKIGKISKLFVKEKWRGQGIGKRLIEEMEKYLINKRCNYIMINVFAPNENAYSIYKRHGYQEMFIDLIKKIK